MAEYASPAGAASAGYAPQQTYYAADTSQPSYGAGQAPAQGYSAPAASFSSFQAPGDGSVSQVGSKRPLDAGAGPSTEPQAKRQDASAPPETVLRLLIPHRKVSGLIGKHGSVIKQIKEMTGCRMRIVEALPGCEERCVIISSPDDPSVERNSAEVALFEVHRRVIDGEESQPAASGQPQGILTRMLVCHSQAGSIIGKSGLQIKEIRDQTGSHIKILPPDELPPCALSNDRVVQLVGQPKALAAALGEVARIVRSNPAKEKPGGPPPSLSAITGIPVGPQAGGLALAAAGRYHGASHGSSANSSGGGAQTTSSFKVLDSNVGSVIGSHGDNIGRIRRESGARIKVHDPNPAEPDFRTVEITGKADQVAAAEIELEQFKQA